VAQPMPAVVLADEDRIRSLEEENASLRCQLAQGQEESAALKARLDLMEGKFRDFERFFPALPRPPLFPSPSFPFFFDPASARNDNNNNKGDVVLGTRAPEISDMSLVAREVVISLPRILSVTPRRSATNTTINNKKLLSTTGTTRRSSACPTRTHPLLPGRRCSLSTSTRKASSSSSNFRRGRRPSSWIKVNVTKRCLAVSPRRSRR
jgi:hypothetical protein